MADVRARGLFSDSNQAVPTPAQLAGKSALIVKANEAALGNFGAKTQAAYDAGMACGMFWDADLWFYSDQGFSPTDKTKWTLPQNDPQFKLMDRFVNNHAIQFAMVDLTITTRGDHNLGAVWLEASGNHILGTMKARYPKLKQIYMYINKSTVEEFSGEDKGRIGAFIINNKTKFPLAFADNATDAASGARPRMPWDDGNMWHWWFSFIPKVEFIYAWNQATLFNNLGFVPGTITPPVIPPTDPTVPTVPPVIPGTLEGKVDWLVAQWQKHFKE